MDLPALASKLVGVHCYVRGRTTAVWELPQLTALRELRLQECRRTDDLRDARLLSGLTSLQCLELDTDFSDGWMLEDLHSLSSLRSLKLMASSGSLRPEALAAVGQATQLTCLEVLTSRRERMLIDTKSQLLPQLTLLQRLRIDQPWLMACGEVLSGLQHLKQLVVDQYEPAEAPPLQLDDLVGALQVWPASLRHLVYLTGFKPGLMRWDADPPQEVVPTPLPGVRVTVAPFHQPLQFSELQKRPLCHGLNMSGLWEVVAQV
jgi:hypothetical protein